MLEKGLYIWFNQTGGKGKELGLCFPEGVGFGGPDGPPDMPLGMPGHPPDRSSDMSGFPEGRPDDPNKLPGGPFPTAARLRILSSEDDEGYNCSVDKAARMGIELKYNIDEQKRFICELKMPMVDTDKTAFIAKASESNQMGTGFVTAKMEMKGLGGGMGDPGGGMGSKAKSLEIWNYVTLAPKPVNIQ